MINNLNQLTKSKNRGKTPRCACCGELIPEKWQAVHVSIPHQRNGIYAHPACLRTLTYHERTPEWFGKYRDKHLTSKAQITFTPEIEGYRKYPNGMSKVEHALYMWGEYKLIPSEDCTVDVEYKCAINVNLHGLGQWFEGVASMVDMTDNSAGLHMNTGWYGMSGYDISRIYDERYLLLAPLRDYMLRNYENVSKIWGRDFNTWASSDMDCVHGSWVNLEHRANDGQGSARIEWRLPHYVDSKQAKQCACMVCDFTQILRSFCEGTRTAKQAGNLILKHYIQAERGEAVWQRPERNKQ